MGIEFHPLGGAHCHDAVDNAAPNEVLQLNSYLVNIKEKVCFFGIKDSTCIINDCYTTVITIIPITTRRFKTEMRQRS